MLFTSPIPRVQASTPFNTYGVSGHSETQTYTAPPVQQLPTQVALDVFANHSKTARKVEHAEVDSVGWLMKHNNDLQMGSGTVVSSGSRSELNA